MPKQPGQVSTISSFIAGASALLVVSLLFLSHHAVNGYYQARLYEQLTISLRAGSAPSELAIDPEYRQLLTSDDTFVKKTIVLIDQLTAQQFIEIKEQMKRKWFPKDLLDDNFRQSIEQATILAKEIGAVETEQGDVRAKQAQNETAFELLRLELKQIVFPNETDADEPQPTDHSTEPIASRIYERGVLAKLPRIEGIPDNLTDLDALLVYAPEIFQEEKNPTRARTALTAQLAELQTSVAEIINTGEHLERRVAALEHKLNERNETLSVIERSLVSDCREILVRLSKPKIHPLTELVYGEIQELASRFQLSLPELPNKAVS